MSSDIDCATKNWYGTVASAGWSHKLPAEPDDLRRAGMKWGLTDGGAPTIYRQALLTAPAVGAASSPDILAELGAALAPLGWSIDAPEPPGWLARCRSPGCRSSACQRRRDMPVPRERRSRCSRPHRRGGHCPTYPAAGVPSSPCS